MKVTTDACLFGAWVAYRIQAAAKEPNRILDIGAGTGVLSLMLAQATHHSMIDALEINEHAYLEAKTNFSSSPWSERTKVFETSLQHFEPEAKYDLIICNPPFFESSLKGKDHNKNQALHEMTLTQNELLRYATKHLSSKGALFILYPEQEMQALLNKSSNYNLLPGLEISIRNKPNSNVFRKMVQLGFTNGETEQSEIIIRAEGNKYTQRFWDLLKPYYLPYNDPNHETGLKA